MPYRIVVMIKGNLGCERTIQALDILFLVLIGIHSWDFPGGLVVKTSYFHCRGHGFDPWSGN